MDLISPDNGLIYWQIGFLVAMIGYLAFTIYAVIDLIRSDFREQHMKLIWALMILFIPVIGVFIYLNMSRSTKSNFRKFDPNFSSNQRK